MMRLEFCALAIVLCLSILSLSKDAGAQGKRDDYRIDGVPAGYHLVAYDDCGVSDRQPHVDMTDAYNFTFGTWDTDDADLKQRSAVFSYKELRINYVDLDPKLPYVLALTYATDHVYKRVQSLWAGDIQLHPPIPLPTAKAIRVIVEVPPEAIRDGKLALAIKIHGEVNATVSIIELYTTQRPKHTLRLGSVVGTDETITGQVLDLAYDGVKGAQVKLYPAAKQTILATTRSGDGGWFNFDSKLCRGKGDIRVTASLGNQEVSATVPASAIDFEPVRYRPIPTMTAGLDRNQIDLNGTWKINPAPTDDPPSSPLTKGGPRGVDALAKGEPISSSPLTKGGPRGVAAGWHDFRVPGQWLQQGFDVPQDQPVAVAREFVIPKQWKGRRIFLRFDAIHGGTDYWLNGELLGRSENLFTPVEFEITDAALPGKTNRLDLKMTVATASERLSHSCGYAFHNLGGIDRSVRLYALPRINIKDLRVLTDLDKDYRDAELKLTFTVDNPDEPRDNLSLRVSLLDARGRPVRLSCGTIPIGIVGHGRKTIDETVRVPNPAKWNAEKPYLYKLVMELASGGEILERIERNIGFRKIEIKGSLLYINGRVVKFAGACHHEIDPLTGRADTARHAQTDVKLMKQANLNYLRTSHYPPTEEILDACDRLGMYVEVEAPFCWVAPTDDLVDLKDTLIPTSAMVDYCHTHPSVIVWSLANESSFNKCFEFANKLVKKLDPTRPTTFNNPDPNRICDIANVHYPPMPYDNVYKDDPRPLFLGEYMFTVCHEQTDVDINPGLRELWGAGQSDPDSDYAKACAAAYDSTPGLMPGAKPGFWSHIYHSNRVIGGAIWAAIDEPYYFANGKHCGYAWVHGFWGLIDAWRRPKPEWWLSKLIFSPVWFPKRQIDLVPGQTSIRVPVENRSAFTDLSELTFTYEIAGWTGKIKAKLAPGETGEIEIPLPLPPLAKGGPGGVCEKAQDSADGGYHAVLAKPGPGEGCEKLILRVTDSHGELINVLAIRIGKEPARPLPRPKSGPPTYWDDGRFVLVEGSRFSLMLNKTTGDFAAADSRHRAPILTFPALHVTRHDYHDLNPSAPPYEVLPDPKTRVIEAVTIADRPNGLEITIKDRYADFAGSVTWLIDSDGVGRLSYDYTYAGPDLDAREIGLMALLPGKCDEVTWDRWSEWDIYPDDSISRTRGTAKARRDPKWPACPDYVKPTWPWSQDQTELGTNDFRSAKFNIYEASLVAPDGTGIRVNANADAHVRPCLAPDGVKLHILSQCPLGRILLRKGDRLAGAFVVSLLPG